MRTLRVVALVAIVATIVAVPTPMMPWQREPRKRPTRPRQIFARVVGDAYAPPWFTFYSAYAEATPPPPLSDNPHDRGRTFLRRGDIPQAIPELREAARNDDPAALTDLAAALITQGNLFWLESTGRASPMPKRFSRQASTVEAIATLHRAIERRPGLAAAHFNLALALENAGFPVEARTELNTAIRLSDDVEWNEEARWCAEVLPLHGRTFERDHIQAYVEITSLPDARRLLQPYLAVQDQRLRRVRQPVYPDSRFLLAS